MGGIPGLSGGEGFLKVAQGAARGAISSAATQGISIAAGIQDKFSFAQVGAAAIGGGITSGLDLALPGVSTENGFASVNRLNIAAASLIGGLANAGVRTGLLGGSFGDNFVAAIPDIIGQAVGGVRAATREAAQRNAGVQAELNARTQATQDRLDDTLKAIGNAQGSHVTDAATDALYTSANATVEAEAKQAAIAAGGARATEASQANLTRGDGAQAERLSGAPQATSLREARQSDFVDAERRLETVVVRGRRPASADTNQDIIAGVQISHNVANEGRRRTGATLSGGEIDFVPGAGGRGFGVAFGVGNFRTFDRGGNPVQGQFLTERLAVGTDIGAGLTFTIIPDANIDTLPGSSVSLEGDLVFLGVVSGSIETGVSAAGPSMGVEVGLSSTRTGNVGVTSTHIFTRQTALGVTQGDLRAASRHGISRAEANRGKQIFSFEAHPDNPDCLTSLCSDFTSKILGK